MHAQRLQRGSSARDYTDRRAGCGEQRTQNILFMFVTLDVTQLSGWLNFLAPCQGSQAQGIRCEASCVPGRREAVSVQERVRLQIGEQIGGCTGGEKGCTHTEHARHVSDAGRLEIKRLIEVRRALPRKRGSQASGTCGAGVCGFWKPGGRRRRVAACGVLAACTVEKARLQIGGKEARGEAHREHAPHVRDAGRVVEFDRLVELLRALPGVASRAYGARRAMCLGCRRR